MHFVLIAMNISTIKVRTTVPSLKSYLIFLYDYSYYVETCNVNQRTVLPFQNWSYLIKAKLIISNALRIHGPPARYVKLRHAPGMTGTFSPTLRVSDPDMHHDTCVTHVPWCMSGSLTSGFLWSVAWKRSRRMRNPQFYASGKRPMVKEILMGQIGRGESHI